MCKYCENTTNLFSQFFQIDNSKINHGDLTGVINNLRMDIRPEDNIYQLDIELIRYDNKGNTITEWSDNCIDIKYCPFCGKHLVDPITKHDKSDEEEEFYNSNEDLFEDKQLKFVLSLFEEAVEKRAQEKAKIKNNNFESLCQELSNIIKDKYDSELDVKTLLDIFISFNQGKKKSEREFPIGIQNDIDISSLYPRYIKPFDGVPTPTAQFTYPQYGYQPLLGYKSCVPKQLVTVNNNLQKTMNSVLNNDLGKSTEEVVQNLKNINKTVSCSSLDKFEQDLKYTVEKYLNLINKGE